MSPLAFLLAAAAAASPPVSFQREIAPILQRRCAACHGEESSKGGYRLDTFARMQIAGESEAPPLMAGKARESELFKRLIATDSDVRMPRKANPLSPEDIALVERWIKEGAPYDGGEPSRPLAALVREMYLRAAPATYPRPLPVTALAFNRDATCVATSGYHEVLIWDVRDGSLVRRIGPLPERTTALAWNDATDTIALAGGTPGQWGTVALLDPAGQPHFLCDLPDVVSGLAFARDGRTLIAGCSDRAVRVFDASSGKTVRVLRQHADCVQQVALNSEGTTLVSVSRDRTARVFDTSAWELVATYTGHETPVSAAAFSRDGSRVFTAARGIGHVWQPDNAAKRGEFAELDGDVRQLVSGPFGVAAGCADGRIPLYQIGEKLPWFTLHGHRDSVQSLAVSPDGAILASGGADGEVIIWNLACGAPGLRFLAVPR